MILPCRGKARHMQHTGVYDLFLPAPAVEYWASQALVLPEELTLGWGDPAVRERTFQI